jgi:hypothetical protein
LRQRFVHPGLCFRELRLSFLCDLFVPLAEFILRKASAMETLKSDCEKHRALTAKLQATVNPKEAEEVMAEIERLGELERYEAFKEKGAAQHDYIFASSYSDEWTEVAGLGALRSWYLCRSGGSAWPCGGLHLSKVWSTLHPNALARGQRYYCCLCGSRYRASWGCIIEISRVAKDGKPAESYFGRAAVPSWDAEDLRAMFYEARKKPQSAEALYEMAKVAHPTTGNFIRPVQPSELTSRMDGQTWGCYKVVNLPSVDELPLWSWEQMFNFACNK